MLQRIFTNWKSFHYLGHDVLFLEKVANSLTDDLFLLIFFLFHHNKVVTIKLKPVALPISDRILRPERNNFLNTDIISDFISHGQAFNGRMILQSYSFS